MQSAPVVYHAFKPQLGILGLKIFDNTYIIGGAEPDPAISRQIVGVHGAGVLHGGFISGIASASEIMRSRQHKNLPLMGQSLRGSITLYILESLQKKLTILPDPLGGGIVFMSKDKDGIAVSSNLGSLVSFLESLGKPPRKSLRYISAYVATGSGGLVDSSYDDISVLPQLSFAEFSPTGMKIYDYPVKGSFFNSDYSYLDSLEQIQAEVVENVIALANAPLERKVAHLTGGVDSRIVLAAILAAGKKDEFSFYCSGGPTEPDKVISSRLAVEFDLTMTDHSGLEFNKAAESLEQQLSWGFEHTSGIISGTVHHGAARTSSGIASGGYGELLRSFYNRGSIHSGTARETAELMYGRQGFDLEPRRRLLSEASSESAQGALTTIIDSAIELGVRQDAQLDYVYMNRRNRYYVGEISRANLPFASRFDPLYSITAASLGLSLDGRSRDANVLGMDLMERLVGGISTFPFDYDRFSDQYIQLRGRPALRSFTGGGTPKFDSFNPARPTNANKVAVLRATEADIRRAHQLRMPPRLIAQHSEVTSGLKEIIAGIPKSEFQSVFNLRAVNQLLDKEPSHRLHYRTASSLYASLLWYFSPRK